MRNQIQPDSPGAAIVSEEEELHHRVQTRVAHGTDDVELRVGTDDLDRDLISLRDQIAEAKPEDLAPLVEQMTRLAAIRSRLGGSRSLPVDIKSPYFAHMTLSEGSKSRDVLVGKRGFIDRKSNVQIVDWRNAPISRIYYRYEEGDDYEEEIAGRRVDGVVSVRRNISIFGGKLRRIGAPQGTFIRDARNVWHEAIGHAAPVLRGGQGKAVRVPKAPPRPSRKKRRRGQLGVHHGALFRADKALPEIAALIDKEQFDLITSPNSGMVVIQGGAGSGKTTVALHRIAYLNFADRSRFKPTAILFVVPSRALVKYVSGVLPSLGVRGVPVVTYEQWAGDRRRDLLRGSKGKYNRYTPDAVSRVKKHPGLLPILEGYAAEQVVAADAELTRAANREEERGAPLLQAWNEAGKHALVPRLARVQQWLRERGGTALPTRLRVAAESILRKLRRRAIDVITDWSEIITDQQRLSDGFAAFGADDISASDIKQTVRWGLKQTGGPTESTPTDLDGNAMSTADGQSLGSDQQTGQGFDREDDPILLRLIQLKRDRLVGREGREVMYEHVAIDEAQDRSAIEVKVLLEATRRHEGGERSITIAGDTAQRLIFDNSFSGWQELLESTGHSAIISPLKLSYRSTAEVMHFANAVLGPELAPEQPLYARSGEPVELHAFGDIGEAVAFLADSLRALAGREPTASVAVIARYAEQADAYYGGLMRAEVPAMRRVRNHEFSFAAGIDITDITQVKGLEFDYVIMVEVTEASYPSTTESRHLMHIGATRAAHQLWLIATGEPSSLVPEVLRDGGQMTVPTPTAATPTAATPTEH